MPTIILGIIPSIISILVGELFILAFGVIFITVGGGDILMLFKLKNENKNNWIQDHPSEAGYYVYKPIKNE
jgi:hypothetical protein